MLSDERQKEMINTYVFFGETVLSVAAYGGKEVIVSLLLDRGADINIVGRNYGSALSGATYSGNEAIVSLLLNRGADIDIAGSYYGSASSAAAYGGKEEIVSLLLDRGVDINIIGGEFGTALGAAAYSRKEAIVWLLLDRGADVNIVGGNFGTALGAATFNVTFLIFLALLSRVSLSFVVTPHFTLPAHVSYGIRPLTPLNELASCRSTTHCGSHQSLSISPNTTNFSDLSQTSHGPVCLRPHEWRLSEPAAGAGGAGWSAHHLLGHTFSGSLRSEWGRSPSRETIPGSQRCLAQRAP